MFPCFAAEPAKTVMKLSCRWDEPAMKGTELVLLFVPSDDLEHGHFVLLHQRADVD